MTTPPTLKEEREAIVESLNEMGIEVNTIQDGDAFIREYTLNDAQLQALLLSHEEKVMARVEETIESYRNIASPLSEEEFDRGYVTACDDMLTTITLSITDEKHE